MRLIVVSDLPNRNFAGDGKVVGQENLHFVSRLEGVQQRQDDGSRMFFGTGEVEDV